MLTDHQNIQILSIGLMSGTSMDGVDATIMRLTLAAPPHNENFALSNIEILCDLYTPYSDEFKNLLKKAESIIRESANDLIKKNIYDKAIILKTADTKIRKLLPPYTLENIIDISTDLHAKAVLDLLAKAKLEKHLITVVGCHGQTFFHNPEKKVSIVLNNGPRLREKTGITVINDFRSKDIANGGQGAPFAPLYHYARALCHNIYPAVIINCGGIANVTIMPSEKEEDLIAFDTGPGNGLIDRFIREKTENAESMDRDGKYGQNGMVHTTVLKELYETAVIKNNQNYFNLAPPKALDLGDFKLIPALNNLSINDACRTLEAFTADSIVESLQALKQFNKLLNMPRLWILGGGGWHNPVILNELKNRAKAQFGEVNIYSADAIGWHSDTLEAEIFAYLAIRSLYQQPLSLPNTTGVLTPTTGGVIYKSQAFKVTC